jgi:lysyl-tRNA synthetase class 2
MNNTATTINEQQLNEEELRTNQRHALITANEIPYKYHYTKTATIQTIITQYSKLSSGENSTTSFKIAGRLIAKRGHGKALFGNIQDDSGTLQVYANINDIGESLFSKIDTISIGDIIGIEGSPFCTKRGELSLRISHIELLTKSLHPLPEKFHGLQDKEKRYRQRYIDLIVNPEVKQTFKTRSKIIAFIRSWLTENDFMEVETPVLQSIYGGAEARPFTTHHNELKQDLFLRISLELPLKRLIVGGFEKIFEIGRVFRNEGVSYKHNPEYTLLELYQAYADYNKMMTLTESLLSELVKKITGTDTLRYKEQTLSFKTPFKRLTLKDALQEYANVNIDNNDAMIQKATEASLELPQNASKIQLITALYDHFVEPRLINPTFIIDHPWETSPLAKKHRDNPALVERFELIINGIEIANAYSELNDPIEQHDRFKDQQNARQKGFENAHQMDEDFVTALKYGMPPTGGLGIGIDRIVMLLTNEHSIRDVLFFPHMKT